MRYRPFEIDGYFTDPPPFSIVFDGRSYAARQGDAIALTLWANGVRVTGRSAKYHRARGAFCGRGQCGQCLARVDGRGNRRLCVEKAVHEQVIESQVTGGRADRDLFAMMDLLCGQAGLDHHHLLTRPSWLNRAVLSVVRQFAGVAELPAEQSDVLQATIERHVQILALGCHGTFADGLLQTLESFGGAVAEVSEWTAVVGYFDEKWLLTCEAGQMIRYRFDVLIVGLDCVEVPPPCPGNDKPGVVSSMWARRCLQTGIMVGHRVALACPSSATAIVHHEMTELATALKTIGVNVLATFGGEDHAAALAKITSQGSRGLCVWADDGVSSVEVDTLVWCAEPLPDVQLIETMGVTTEFDPQLGGFVPRVDVRTGATQRPDLRVVWPRIGQSAESLHAYGVEVAQCVVAQLGCTARFDWTEV